MSDCELQLVEKSIKNKFIINNLKFISAICFILANINIKQIIYMFFEPKIYSNISSGSVEVICGSMFSGKLKNL